MKGKANTKTRLRNFIGTGGKVSNYKKGLAKTATKKK